MREHALVVLQIGQPGAYLALITPGGSLMRYPAQCSVDDCDNTFTVPFEPRPDQSIYCRDHMIYDDTEAYDMGKEDGKIPGSPVNKGRMAKNVRDSYMQGFREARKEHRDAINAIEREYEQRRRDDERFKDQLFLQGERERAAFHDRQARKMKHWNGPSYKP